MIQIKTRTKQNQHTHRRAWSNTGTSHRYTHKNTHKTKSHRTTKTSIPLRACASTKVPITLATGATHRSLHCRRTYPQVSIKNENVHSEGILVLTSAEVHATTRWPLNASCLVSPWLLFSSAIDCFTTLSAVDCSSRVRLSALEYQRLVLDAPLQHMQATLGFLRGTVTNINAVQVPLMQCGDALPQPRTATEVCCPEWHQGRSNLLSPSRTRSSMHTGWRAGEVSECDTAPKLHRSHKVQMVRAIDCLTAADTDTDTDTDTPSLTLSSFVMF